MNLDGRRIVTRDGRVFHETQSAAGPVRIELPQVEHASGYLTVAVHDEQRRFIILFVHRLVAREFLPARPTPEHELRHLNGNRFDNRASNLAWGTHAENMADARAHGRMKAAAQLAAAKRHMPQMELFDWTLEAARCAHQLDVQAKQKLHARLERWRHDPWGVDQSHTMGSPGEPPPSSSED